MGKKGVLLINVGTPDEPTVKSVRNYLREFLLDPDVIDAPYIIRQLLVRGIILRVRPRKIAPLYQKIWMDEGSPLRVYSDRITKSLNDMDEEIEFEFAMRYGNPSIMNAIKNLQANRTQKLFLVSMFPQYAEATSGSTFREVERILKEENYHPEIIKIDHYATEEFYLNSFAKSIKESEEYKKEVEEGDDGEGEYEYFINTTYLYCENKYVYSVSSYTKETYDQLKGKKVLSLHFIGKNNASLFCSWGANKSVSRAFFVTSVFKPITISASVLDPSKINLGNKSPAENLRSHSQVFSKASSIEGPGPHSDTK